MVDFRLDQKVAIVTGAGTGIGKGIAVAFAGAGAHAVLVGRHAETIGAVSEEMKSMGVESVPVVGDVTDAHDVSRIREETMARFGRIDILVNNAGGTGGYDLMTPVVEMSDQQWLAALQLNLTSTFFCCREIGKIMIEQRFGSIINISSASGQRGRPGGAAYAASKAAVINLSQSLAAELAGYGIRVNVIAPGPIDVRETSEAERAERAERSGILVGRVGRPADVAAAAVYLAADASDFVTGAVLDVRGGPMLREADVKAFRSSYPPV